MMMKTPQTKTYEMLWDCAYCNTAKLLGKTHRFCPNCGAQQEANKRYYPADDEKVAVEDHRYIGADKTCAACQTANAADAAFCMQCGAALSDAIQVKSLRAELQSARKPFKQSKQNQSDKLETPPVVKKSRQFLFLWLGLAAVVLLAVVVLAVFWTKVQTLVVTGHHWSRAVLVEDYAPRHESAWCEQLPQQAYALSRKQEMRSYQQIADGEVCQTQRLDQGDGTYVEKELCQPKYRREPVYADKCYYQIDRWAYARTITAKGDDLQPYWPKVQLQCANQPRIGCEREQERTAEYTVILQNQQQQAYDCPVAQEKWQSLANNSTWTAEIGKLLNDIRCDSLQPLD
jgi:hypothetical protein